MERERLKIVDESGVALEVEMVSIIEDKDENTKYLIYTKGEAQKSGNKILYISKLVNSEKGYVLYNIDGEDEWVNVKKIMSEIVSG